MEADNTDDISLKIVADDTSLDQLQDNLAQHAQLIFKITEEESLALAKVYNAQINAAQNASKKLAEYHDAIKQSFVNTDNDYLKQFEVNRKQETILFEAAEKKMNELHVSAIKDQIAADKQYIQEFEANRKQETILFETAEKRMNQLHAEALKENARLDKANVQPTNTQPGLLQKYGSAFGMGLVGGLAGGVGLGATYAGYQAASGVKDFVSGGIETADKIRDVDAAIRAYTKSATEATNVINQLNKAEDTTRLTSLELKKIFVDILPKSQAIGLSAQSTANIATEIANVATFRNASAESLASGYNRIIGGGRMVGNNPLINALGLTPDELNKLKDDGTNVVTFIQGKLKALSDEAQKQGGTLASVWKQTKFDLTAAFAEGFTEARGNAMTGMAAIKGVLTDPGFLDTIKVIGNVVARGIELVAGEIEVISGTVRTFWNMFAGGFHSIYEEIVSFLDLIITKIGAFSQAHPSTAKLLNLPTQAELAPVKSFLDDMEKDASKNTKSDYNGMLSGFNQVLKGEVDKYKAIFGGNIGGGYSFSAPPPNGNDNPTQNNDKIIKRYDETKAKIEEILVLTDALNAKEITTNEVDKIRAEWQQKITTLKEQEVKAQLSIQLMKDKDVSRALSELGRTVPNGIDPKAFLASATETAFDSGIAKDQAQMLQNISQYYDGINKKADDYTRSAQEGLKAITDQLDVFKQVDPVLRAQAETEATIGRIEKIRTDTITHLQELISKVPAENTNEFLKLIGQIDAVNSTADKAGVQALNAGTTRVFNIGMAKDEKQWAQDHARELKKAIKDQETFKDAISGIVGAFVEGGSNFAKNIERAFTKFLKTDIGDYLDKLYQKLAGVTEVPVTDPITGQTVTKYTAPGLKNPVSTPQQAVRQSANHGNVDLLNAGLSLGAIAINGFSGGASGAKGSNLSAGLTGAITGAEVGAKLLAGIGPFLGPAIGAAIGLVVGLIGSAIGKAEARADYKYGVPNITAGGQSSFTQSRNINPDDVKKMNSQIQDAFDTSWNSWVNVLTKVQGSILPTLAAINGKFQDASSSHFLDNFQTWLTRTLPDQIAKQFQEGMGNAATMFGMSIDKFNLLWKKFSNLDPTQQAQVWSDIFDTLTNITKLAGFYGIKYTGSNSSTTSNGASIYNSISSTGVMPSTADRFGMVRSDMNKTFVDTLTEGDVQIFNRISGIEHETGAQQIKDIKSVSDTMTERYDKEKQYMQQLLQMQDAVKEQVDGMLNDLTAQGFKKADGSPDYQTQATFYQGLSEQDVRNMQSAKTPEALQKAWDAFIADSQKAAGAQANMGPNNAESARTWLMATLQVAQGIFNAQVTKLGDALSVEDKYFTEHVQPFFDKFTTNLTTLGGTVDDTTTPINDFNGDIDDAGNKIHTIFAPAIVEATTNIVAFGAALKNNTPTGTNDNGGHDGGQTHGGNAIDPFYYISYYGYGR